MQIETVFVKPTEDGTKSGELLLVENGNEMCLALAIQFTNDRGILLLSGRNAGKTDYFPDSGFLQYIGGAKLHVAHAASAWVKERPDVPVALWTDGALWRLTAFPNGAGLSINVQTGEVGGMPYRGWYVKDWEIVDGEIQLLP
ncbi:hypothetical protein [Rugamonas aquatica]|uniref:Uncharacterized protein n=1 Tax=Rugamonas aquatica TaxID=2743357 RepID=A0A6A7N102_9BURK|nr:hypothetical protein [Rugamonas aquatica]MQA38631.1 hypothetical protein [Rugamonas aquatica]